MCDSRLFLEKKCQSCKQARMVIQFPTARYRICKTCRLFRESGLKTPPEIAIAMYANAVSRCRYSESYIRKGIQVRMEKRSFVRWAIPKIHEFLWTQEGKPSLDRIKDDGDYEFGNLQIISQPKNSGKHSTNKSTQIAEHVRRSYPSRTQQALAAECGVSISTVSRIINNKLDCCRSS